MENKSFEKFLEYLYVTGQLDNQDDSAFEKDNPDIAIKMREKDNDE